MGLGAGVGGEAGADGRRGFEIDCGIEEGKVVFGVRGGLGWACCIESLRREVRWPTATGTGGGFARMLASLSISNEAEGRCVPLCRCSIAHPRKCACESTKEEMS